MNNYMKQNILLIPIVAVAAWSCSHTEKSPFERRVADYAVVTLPAPDLSGITDNGKEVLNLYRFAADEVDAIYWEQYFGDKSALLEEIQDPKEKEYACINYGPWDRINGASFVEGYGDRLPGAGFYPADMTKEEFEAWDNPDTPDGKAGARPDYAVTVYTQILKKLFPDVPVVIGGIEASLRRLTHYDYWKDCLMPSVLVSSGADYLCYGMGERPMLELTKGIEKGWPRHRMQQIPQIAFFVKGGLPGKEGTLVLHSFEECCKDKRAFAENFHWIETHANMMHPDTILEPVADGYVQINPPYPPATTEEMDSFWDLPFTKLPHPRYKGKRIPAYDMIKFSVNTHRGCFGGCNFCTIAAHQGKFIQSRSEKSILKEVKELNNLPDFAGNISDVGAPTANMYWMSGKNPDLCDKCKRRSCLFPKRCPNLSCDHTRLMELYRKIDSTKSIRHSYIGSGIRYDLFLTEDAFVDESSKPYLKTLVLDHTSGRLKVAPEHTEDHVLQKMAKPSFKLFEHLRKEFVPP